MAPENLTTSEQIPTVHSVEGVSGATTRVVLSWHARPNTLAEIGPATALGLEGDLGRGDWDTWLNFIQFRDVVQQGPASSVYLIDTPTPTSEMPSKLSPRFVTAVAPFFMGLLGAAALSAAAAKSRGMTRRFFAGGIVASGVAGFAATLVPELLREERVLNAGNPNATQQEMADALATIAEKDAYRGDVGRTLHIVFRNLMMALRTHQMNADSALDQEALTTAVLVGGEHAGIIEFLKKSPAELRGLVLEFVREYQLCEHIGTLTSMPKATRSGSSFVPGEPLVDQELKEMLDATCAPG